MGGTGERIRELRKLHGLDQKVLAKTINTPAGQLSRWECGKVEPSILSIRKIARALAIDERDIIGNEDVLDDGTILDRRHNQIVRMICEGLAHLSKTEQSRVLTVVEEMKEAALQLKERSDRP